MNTKANGASAARWEALTQVYHGDNLVKKGIKQLRDSTLEDCKPMSPSQAQDEGSMPRVCTQWHYSLHRTKMASQAAPALIWTPGSLKLGLGYRWTSAAVPLLCTCSSFSTHSLVPLPLQVTVVVSMARQTEYQLESLPGTFLFLSLDWHLLFVIRQQAP